MGLINWNGKPWWWRPLFAVAVGLAAGLVLTTAITQLPNPEAEWALTALLIVIMLYALWTLWDLRRLQRDHKEKMADFERWFGSQP